ncbi:epoxide hydrolase family protein [Pseudonocardia sp. TRM90224]|uniref:epoxide hydrolase family protein n=1 Tax=Pseudonocardia sp. TRM90224 TaxID=2812678 RepID=UPI001E2BA64F|nr:epoxide hydrolase family protein [Pseudonocardia sp. TRM90224]
MEITPFRIDVPQADLDDLADRLARTRYTEELTTGGDYGVRVDPVRELVSRWRDGFDWRAVERRLNEIPQFTTTIDGQNIHFLHVRSPEPDAFPLILTHGWPGSFVEFLDVIGPLTDPRAHGGDPAQAFHVVVPSLPGFAFSGPTTEPGWNRYRTAKAWAQLMAGLGYERYGAHGNDGGSFVAPELGRFDAEHVVGVHVDQIYSFPTGDPAEFAGMSEAEMAELAQLQEFSADKLAYNELQAMQPQNLAHALADSPAGQLAWSYQLFGDAVSPEFVLTNVAIYWFTRTTASSMRFYWEDRHTPEDAKPQGPTTVPLGLAAFAFDFSGIRRFAERDHANIVSWTEFDRGGHYPAHEVPDLLVGDLRRFFAGLRG